MVCHCAGNPAILRKYGAQRSDGPYQNRKNTGTAGSPLQADGLEDSALTATYAS